MAMQEQMVPVGYKGKTYQIPVSVSAANTRTPGVAVAYIEDQIAAEQARKAAAKTAADLNVEKEFRSVREKLEQVDAHDEQLKAQAASIKAYKEANKAQEAQIKALQSTKTGLDSSSGEAREAAQELALQTTNSAVLLETLRQREDHLTGVIEGLELEVEALEAQLKEKTEEAAKLGQSRMFLEQERSNRCLDKAYKAEERAVAAEKVAADALSKAENSRQMTKDQFTRADVLAMVQAEIRVSAEQIVEMVIDSLRPELPQGWAGQRMSREYVDQTTRDRQNNAEIRVGMDEAFKNVLRRTGSA